MKNICNTMLTSTYVTCETYKNLWQIYEKSIKLYEKSMKHDETLQIMTKMEKSMEGIWMEIGLKTNH